jgi:hypothetical protein
MREERGDRLLHFAAKFFAVTCHLVTPDEGFLSGTVGKKMGLAVTSTSKQQSLQR